MIAQHTRLRDVVGPEFERTLSERAQQMLLEAFARSGVALGRRNLSVHVADALGIAAARTLAASGLLRQDLDGEQPAEVYAFFSITQAGAVTVTRLMRTR